jgi:uncharacterized protein (DUF488 family)
MASVPAVISDAQIKEHDDFETSALSLNFSEFENALKQLNIDISHEAIRELFKKSKAPKQVRYLSMYEYVYMNPVALTL